MIGVEGAQTPAGGRDREDPTGRMPEEASGPPAGKRSAWNGNQLYFILKKGRISNVKLASSSSLLLTLYATKR
ncbi:hypothetical protein AAV98_06960 [Bacillus sp. CHD6a]|nr:hypothetical protein AAV98_06960 [Bacillus sp. CHD6a]